MRSAGDADLAGHVVVVAGASSGVGLVTARLFDDRGATVYALARRKDEIVRSAGPRSERFSAKALDVTDYAAVARAIQAIGASGIDTMVVAAGLNVPRRRIAELAVSDWEAILNVNLNAAFYLISSALPSLRERHGTVILIASASAVWPNVSGAAYQASKAGLLGLARAAAYEEHTNGVRFSVLLPGIVDTPHLDRRSEPPDAEMRKRMLQPEDVANACMFLATLPARAYVPEMVLLPTTLQAPGKTDERAAYLSLPPAPHGL